MGSTFLSRFTLVCDRAVYSPEFFAEAKAERIALLTYHKFPGPDWAVEEFAQREVKLVSGEMVKLVLAPTSKSGKPADPQFRRG